MMIARGQLHVTVMSGRDIKNKATFGGAFW